MTGFTNIRAIDVTVRQIVATGTGTSAVDLRMIHGKCRCPTRSPMTGFTNIRAIDVTVRQIVATGTGTSTTHLRMIHGRYRNPAR